jgi:uncharacterized protein YdhG (YjbR/CyaY superfamily)
MVQSSAADVETWLAEADPGRASYLRRIRERALANLPGFTEAMRYGMPTYSAGDGEAAFAFNAQKQYISLYVPPEVHARNAEALSGLDAGKSCIRFRKPDAIDFDLLDKLLQDTAATRSGVCG